MLELEGDCWGSGDVKKDDIALQKAITSTTCLPEDGGGAGLEPNVRGRGRGRGGDKARWSRLGTAKNQPTGRRLRRSTMGAWAMLCGVSLVCLLDLGQQSLVEESSCGPSSFQRGTGTNTRCCRLCTPGKTRRGVGASKCSTHTSRVGTGHT